MGGCVFFFFFFFLCFVFVTRGLGCLPAPGTYYLLSFISFMELSIYRGWQEVFFFFFFFSFFFLNFLLGFFFFFFFFFFFSRGLGCLPAPRSVTKAIAGLQIRALLKLLGCLYNN